MHEKCKTCLNGWPNVECTNCGTGFVNYRPFNRENIVMRDELREFQATDIASIIRALRHISHDKSVSKIYEDGVTIKGAVLCDAADLIERQMTELANYESIKKALQSAGFKDLDDLLASYEQVKNERDAAVKDIDELLSSTGMHWYAACGFCSMPDDNSCIIDQNTCRGKWRGLNKTVEKPKNNRVP